jgi:hypothetical protein
MLGSVCKLIIFCYMLCVMCNYYAVSNRMISVQHRYTGQRLTVHNGYFAFENCHANNTLSKMHCLCVCTHLQYCNAVTVHDAYDYIASTLLL